MRLVLDTNVVASGLLWNGAPAQLIDVARADEVELFSSRVLLAELTRILRRVKFSKAITTSGLSLDELVLGYAELVTLVTPASIPPTILRDPDDDHVLACAVAANAELIVSGDRDVLDLKTFREIQIVHVAQAVKLLAG
jgi:uncharacterized protein